MILLPCWMCGHKRVTVERLGAGFWMAGCANGDCYAVTGSTREGARQAWNKSAVGMRLESLKLLLAVCRVNNLG
jgi:hypothetical protein